jgi:hypothetical protein
MNKLLRILIGNKTLSYFNFIRHNTKEFKNNNSNGDGQILIEYNAFQSFHIPISYFSNYLKKKFNAEIFAFYNYSILVSPLEISFLQKIRWYLANFLSLKNFKIYKSFGTKKIFRPEINYDHTKKAKKKFDEIKKNIFRKEDVLNIKIDNIRIGDLLYDTYLKKFMKPTLDLNDKHFDLMLFDFCKLFFFWKDYIENSNVKAIVGVHTSYAYGLILRIGINKNIKTYAVSIRKINRLSEKMRFVAGEFINFPEIFQNIPENIKSKGLNNAKSKLEKRFQGLAGVEADLISSELSSFSKVFMESKIEQNDKIKILISPHDFFDAVHSKGDILFPDFYEWMLFLGEMSNKTNYDWYIKNRPNFSGKFQKFQPFTNCIIDHFIKKYNKIKKLPNDYSHNQIIKEKIDFVFTCYGSVGTEYPLFNIPVVNASKNNPHHRYNFNLNPKSIEELKEIILNLPNINFSINKDEIYEHYFLKHIYLSKNWMIDDLKKYLDYVGGWTGQNSYRVYEYWLSKIDNKKRKQIFNSIENFINSDEDAITIKHLDN